MARKRSFHVSLIATPEADASALAGMHGALVSFQNLVPDSVRFHTEIVLPDSLLERTKLSGSVIDNVLGVTIPVHHTLGEVARTDVLIIPSLFVFQNRWPRNPYPELTAWIMRMYRQGTLVCSACTGALLLAETGLLDGYEATQHWAFERLFRSRFPNVNLNVDKALVTTGTNGRIVMSGASAAWHDLVLHVIAKLASPREAQVIAKFFLLQCHVDGQAPYRIFDEFMDHGDAAIGTAQAWLHQHSHEPHPVEMSARQANLPERTFNRRFRAATGHTPIAYVQRLRVEAAKRQLETGTLPVEEIGWRVGYEDPASFRRVFKRIAGMTPKAYRMKFRIGREKKSGE